MAVKEQVVSLVAGSTQRARCIRANGSQMRMVGLGMVALSTVAALLPEGVRAQTLPTPIVQYSFTSAGANNLGSDTTAGLTYVTTTPQAKTSTVTGPGGTSVAVFDNTSATGQGSSGTGGYATTASTLTSLTGLSSLTMTGWMYTPTISSGLAATARIFVNGNSTNGIIIYSDGNGQLELKDNATRLLDSSVGAYSPGGGWTFFAVTYSNDTTVSGTTTVGATLSNFYEATASAPTLTNVTPALSPITNTTNYVSLTGGTTAPVGVADFGDISSLARPYDGYLYDFRIYGSTSGDSGVLSAAQLSVIENSALQSSAGAPEPGALALLAPGIVAGLVGIRRRRQS